MSTTPAQVTLSYGGRSVTVMQPFDKIRFAMAIEALKVGVTDVAELQAITHAFEGLVR